MTLRQRIQEAFGSRRPDPATPGIGEAGHEAVVVEANAKANELGPGVVSDCRGQL